MFYRKFHSPSGMSEEEIEQKETYKKVLEYEQDMVCTDNVIWI